MSLVKLRNIVKVYKQGFWEVMALGGVSLDVAEGEVLALIGSSGSGKSTLLNIIGGISVPTAGSVVVDNLDLTQMSPNHLTLYRRRYVGFLWQETNLLEDLSLLDNIQYVMYLSEVIPKKEIKPRALALLTEVGLEARLNHRPNEVSGGELSRAGLAVALANDPPILLIDEPTGELDSSTGEQIMEFLLHLAKKSKKSLIIVTHDPDVAKKADKTLVMDDGLVYHREDLSVVVSPDGKLVIPPKFRAQFQSKSVRVSAPTFDSVKIKTEK